jgi:plastocyanin
MRRLACGLLVFASVAACGGLSHPVSNDGSDAGNTGGANPGTTTLTISARSDLVVGDTASITGSLGGMAITNNGSFQATSSDPSVVFVGGISLFARSVGTATINAQDNGYQAALPVTVSVSPAANGASAIVGVQNTNPPAFAPASVSVKVGAQVQFGVGTTHSVAFDAVPGAPQNVQAGAGAVLRTFTTTGTFTYQCTAHGETGQIVVTP